MAFKRISEPQIAFRLSIFISSRLLQLMQGCPEYVAGGRVLQERDDTQPIRSYARLDRESDLFIDLMVRTNLAHLRKVSHYSHMSQIPARVLAARYLGFGLVVSQSNI